MKIDPKTIQQVRESLGWTMHELARQAGISVSALSLIERGKRESPWPGTIEKIATALGVGVDDLRPREEPRDALMEAFVAGYLKGGNHGNEMRPWAINAYSVWKEGDK